MNDIEQGELPHEDFSTATGVESEGARVGFVSCLRCGAAIMLDPRDDDDRLQTHLRWHDLLKRGLA